MHGPTKQKSKEMNICLLFAFTRFWHLFVFGYSVWFDPNSTYTILGVSSDKGNVYDRRGSSNYNSYMIVTVV